MSTFSGHPACVAPCHQGMFLSAKAPSPYLPALAAVKSGGPVAVLLCTIGLMTKALSVASDSKLWKF